MSARLPVAFGALIAAQGVHSIEEYAGRMWESHPLARFVSSLVSSDLERGFVVANALLVMFGLWCLMWPVRRRWRVAIPLAWGWAAVEAVNGIAHPVWSLIERGYRPGLATAPLLLVLALHLAKVIRTEDPKRDKP